VAAFESLTVQDRFVLRFWHRYGAFIPLKGIALRSRAQLDAKIRELGGKAGLAKIFADDPDTAVTTSRRREIRRFLTEGYLAAGDEVDPISQEMVQHPVDRLAIEKGCRYDTARAMFAIEWMETHLVLYEGECAGEPFTCHDWQDVVSRRLFGWVIWSDKHQRWVRRFRWVIVFIAKKNKKSPTLAAWSIYLAFGDGEPGMHVYLCAKDGQQARKIAGRHTIEMITRSPLLFPECKINQNEKEVTHLPTSSTILPLSSSNERNTKAKEGLNGSYLIDESHVVDYAYVDRIKRMGISRPEPIGGDLSTAGNDPDSYGKSRRDYGLAVNACKEVQDIHTCAAIYEMPQKITEDQFAKNPTKYGKMANPAWGHTIDPAEFLADFETSRISAVELRQFFMYRGNVWQKTASPWLRPEKWVACASGHGPGDLIGRPCGGAWDLMRSKDMAALALLFPEDDVSELEARADMPHELLLWYWMPEAAIELYLKKVPAMRRWAEDGWIRTMEGETISYSVVEEETAAILSQYDVQRFNYDPMFAGASAQRLVETYGFDEERIVEFPQTTKYYTYPICVFDDLVVNGKLTHNGNPVTDWQAGHVCLWERDGKKRITKPDGDSNSWKKIDGIAAAVMGLDAALRRDPTAGLSVYAKAGVFYAREGDTEEENESDEEYESIVA
jgi:phage terminase large subunit-like protein